MALCSLVLLLEPEIKDLPKNRRKGIILVADSTFLITAGSTIGHKAEQTLLDQRFFMVDEQTWLAFQDALESPAQAKKGMQSLIAEPAIWEKAG